VTPSGIALARRPLKPGPSVLLPTVSATAIMWLRGDLGPQKDTSGTVCTTSGDTVALWADQTYSPVYLHHAQAQNLPADNAQYQLNQINGLPCVRFNGTSAALAATFTMPAAWDIFMMVKPIAWADGSAIVASRAGLTWAAYQSGSSPNIVTYNGVSNSTADTHLTVGSWALLEAWFGSSPNDYLKVNNNTATTHAALSGSGFTGIYIGSRAALTFKCNMDVAEILVYDANLGTGDATAVRSYFTTRYGIP